MKKLIILLLSMLILTGCWDEKQYKFLTTTPLIGVEGTPEHVDVTYSFPTFEDGKISYTKTIGSGQSLRDARNNANYHTGEILDIAHLEVVLMTEDTAVYPIYNYIDSLYRNPSLRLGGYLAIVEGEIASYMDASKNLQGDVSGYISQLIKTSTHDSFIPKIDFHITSRTLFDNEKDLILPYFTMDEREGVPQIDGVALFSKGAYTGVTLSKDESLLLNIMNDDKGKTASKTYKWKKDEKETSVTFDILNIKRKRKIENEKVKLDYEIKINISEFSQDHLMEKKVRVALEKELGKKFTEDFKKIIEKLQLAKSDAMGLGRIVRPFHPKLWEKGEWQETFSKLEFDVSTKVKIIRSGVLN